MDGDSMYNKLTRKKVVVSVSYQYNSVDSIQKISWRLDTEEITSLIDIWAIWLDALVSIIVAQVRYAAVTRLP